MRLIDADSLFEELFRAWGTEIDAGPANDFMAMINNAPTITPPPNDPLTLEKLRGMDLMDWVWVEILKPSRFRRTKSGYYCKFDDYTSGEAFCCGWPGTIFALDYYDFGDAWLAYRHKPKEN